MFLKSILLKEMKKTITNSLYFFQCIFIIICNMFIIIRITYLETLFTKY